MSLPQIIVKNQFGEEAIDSVLSTSAQLQALSTIMPAKAEVTALVAQPTDGSATLLQTVTQLNALIAALKAIT